MDDDNASRPRKRYKLFLDPDYRSEQVSKLTHDRWSKKENSSKSERKQQESSSTAGSSTKDTQRDYFMETDNISEDSEDQGEELIEEFVLSESETESNHLNKSSIDSPEESESEAGSIYSDNSSNNTSERIAVHDDTADAMLDDEPADTVRRPHLLVENREMFSTSHTTIGDVLEMIAAFSTRFSITLEGRLKLFDMFKICAGPQFDNLKISNYMFSKLFDPPQDKIRMHFYCFKCAEPLLVTNKGSFTKEKSQDRLCEKCSQPYELTSISQNCFLSIDLQFQIEQMLKNPVISEAFVDKIKSRNTASLRESISDVDDSLLYRAVVKKHPNAIIYAVSTDGASAKNAMHCKTSFWPLQVLFHDLPTPLRYQFLLLLGVMIVYNEPGPKLLNLFLKSFVDQALELSKKDIPVLVDGETHLLKFIPLFSSVDSPARALMQNRMKHSAYCACSYCYIYGFYTQGAVRYPFEEKDSQLRTAESHRVDVKTILETNCLMKSNGVKGDSAFSSLPDFDIVWSFCFDLLHTVLLGAAEDFIRDSNFPTKIIDILDARLMAVHPSHEILRLPQKLSKKLVWKGTEWRSWLLFFSLPMCIDLLPADVLENYALLVKSIYTLLKLEISQKDLVECNLNLTKFLKGYQELYGIGSMKFNIHMIKHIVECTIRAGPIALTSTFVYESNIGFLKRVVTGTKNMGLQMAKKSMQFMSYKCKTRDYSSSPLVKSFCESLFSDKKFTLSAQIRNGITLFGKPYSSVDTDTAGGDIYTKCIYRKQTYHSVEYNRSSKFNDTIVQLECGTIAQILEIIVMTNDDCYFLVWKLEAEKMVVGDLEMPHIWKVTGIIDKVLVPLNRVCSKLIFLQFEDKNYACKPPNVIENS